MEQTILIIDDDVDFQFMIGSLLRMNGYNVKALLDGNFNAALTMASECDIILLDVDLPGMNGVDLGEKLRSAPETSKIPIMIVSGHNEGDAMFHHTPANAFIQKPFSLSGLIDKIQSLLVPA